MENMKIKQKGMHITEYTHMEYDNLIHKCKGFVITSQFDQNPENKSLQGHNVCLTGEVLFGLIEGKFVKLKAIIDSSD